LVNYGARHRKGLPISSSIAESAVNHVVSYRMAKKRQMRWTDEGAHCMVQVRVAVLNGEFSPRRISALKIADSGCGKCIRPASAGVLWQTDSTDRATCRESWSPDEIDLPKFCTLSTVHEKFSAAAYSATLTTWVDAAKGKNTRRGTV
jgi:hypothetical protein